MIVKIGAALALLSAAGGAIGYNFPQIATKDEVVQLAGSVQSNTNEIIGLNLRLAREALTDLRILEGEMKATGKPVPSWLIKDKVELEAEIEELKRKLK